MADDNQSLLVAQVREGDEKIRILLAALLWLRNHYDATLINGTGSIRKEVVARIDRVLADYDDLHINDLKAFRKAYPMEDLDGS